MRLFTRACSGLKREVLMNHERSVMYARLTLILRIIYASLIMQFIFSIIAAAAKDTGLTAILFAMEVITIFIITLVELIRYSFKSRPWRF